MKSYTTRFLRDHLSAIVIVPISFLVLDLFLIAFKIPLALIIFINLFFGVVFAVLTITDYVRRAKFYHELQQNFQQLQQKYLITEILERPNFLDGQILHDLLYETDKSMREEITRNSAALDDFCEYLELWIHEAKTPISTVALLNHNPDIATELAALDNYLEQILYFARSKNADQDYLFKSVKLSQIVERLAERNRVIFQKHDITLKTSGLDVAVDTDSKWLEFIVNQLFQNSVKYGAKNITICAAKHAHDTGLSIIDDGIGISAKDLPRVFEKSFTGQNGRKYSGVHSTGMGLYIVKNLCDKLGHTITITSPNQSGTIVTIDFHDHDYYKNVISA